jgi:hypothetical protein
MSLFFLLTFFGHSGQLLLIVNRNNILAFLIDYVTYFKENKFSFQKGNSSNIFDKKPILAIQLEMKNAFSNIFYIYVSSFTNAANLVNDGETLRFLSYVFSYFKNRNSIEQMHFSVQICTSFFKNFRA